MVALELLKINSTKLKITLAPDECARYGIKEAGGDFDTRSVREVVADILDEAGAGGFCKPKEKILVQLYPAKGGGAELFITKLSTLPEREQKAITSSEHLSTYTREMAAFAFESFSDLVRASKLPSLGGKRSDLYLCGEGKFLLLIEEKRLGLMSDCDVLSEFGSRLPQGSAAPLAEWDKLLASGDAIAKLSKLRT